MMTTTLLAWIILVGFIIIYESLFRPKGVAKEIRIGGRLSIHSFLYMFLVLLGLAVTPILDYMNIGKISGYPAIGWLGVGLLILGLAIRVVAGQTLGKFHMRSLRIVADHRLIKTGVYKYIRHPGYLGTIVGGIGFAMATNNWIIIFYACISLAAIFILRINEEERMMLGHFGEEYIEYTRTTKRLIPFIY